LGEWITVFDNLEVSSLKIDSSNSDSCSSPSYWLNSLRFQMQFSAKWV
jgi:hypothetical protein